MLHYKSPTNELFHLSSQEYIKDLPPNCTQITWDEVKEIQNPATLEETKERKRNQIRLNFDTVANQPVIINSVNYHGGFESAIKLDAAKRLMEAAGLSQVIFFDTSNQPHTLTLVEAQNVVIQVASAYQTALANKQAKMVLVSQAQTKEEVNAILP